jgi:hypothetical protein
MEDLLQGVKSYVEHLQNNYNLRGYSNKEYYFELGRKYIHVIMKDNQRCSHSWIMMEDDKKFKRGDILKSAGWKAPARNFSRGNVLSGNFKHIQWAGI